MALPAILESVDGLSEDIKKEYIEKDGKFVLDVTAVDGFALEDVGGLKKSLASTRQEREEFKKKLGVYEGLDPEEARRAMETLANMDAAGDDAGAAEEKIRERYLAKEQALTEKHRKEKEEWEAQSSSLNGRLHKQEIDRVISDAIREHKGVDHFLREQIRGKVKVEELDDGGLAVRVLNKDGETEFSGKAGDYGPMSVSEFVGKLKEDANWAPAFEGTGATGGGATGSTVGRSGAGRIDPNDKPELRMAAFRGGVGM